MKILKLFVLTLCLTIAQVSLAQYTGPAVSMFYPGQNDESPMELKPTAKAYVYFVSGTKAVEVKATVEQNGHQVATCVYAGSATGVTTCTMDPNKPDNASMANIQPGLFTIKFYQVTYISDGEQLTYSDASAPFAQVTYKRSQSNGTITSQTGLENGVVKSYFPTDGDEGVKTYAFSKAVKPGVSAYFLYGRGDFPNETSLPATLADDGMSLTIDMRGTCYNVDALAPGVVFTDDEGTPCDPPSTITLVVEGLNCVDGTKITTTSTSLDGQFSTTLDGKVYQSYHYVDLTHPTPSISMVKFYQSSAPDALYDAIDDRTDMAAVYVSNSELIAVADVIYTTGQLSASTTAQVGDGVLRASIPNDIRVAGTPDLVITLDVTYTQEDGAEHIIPPYDLGNILPELTTLADILAQAPETTVTVNLVEGMTVTFASAELGLTFAEDATGALMITTSDYSMPLARNTLVKGKISGQYWGAGLYVLDTERSQYTQEDCVPTPACLKDEAALAGIAAGDYDNRLVYLDLADFDGTTFSLSADDGYIEVKSPAGNELLFLTSSIEGFAAPSDEIVSITLQGVVYADNTNGKRYILMRDGDDCQFSVAGIEGVQAEAQSTVYYDLHGVKTQGTPRPGIYVSKNKKIIIK